MARERMVTRTVMVTVVEAICMDITTVETSINTYELSGSFTTSEQVLKALKKVYETATFKVVAVQSMTDNEVLYGMSELDFIKLAKVLPPRGSKVDEAQAEDEAPAQAEDEAPEQAEDEAPIKRGRKSTKSTK